MKQGSDNQPQQDVPPKTDFGTLVPPLSQDSESAAQADVPQPDGTLTPELWDHDHSGIPQRRPYGTLPSADRSTVTANQETLPEPQHHKTVFVTHAAGGTLVSEIAAQQHDAPEPAPLTDDSTRTMLIAADHDSRVLPPDDELGQRRIGKSTWNLRIHRRDVAGDMSGVINRIPTDSSTATGLQSALAADDETPEYEVLGRLGAGNMGIVYRARQTSLNRDLAVKTLKPGSKNIDHDQAMFVSEAVVTANLVHPNIVPIHDLGRTSDGKLFYSMKQVRGTAWNATIRGRKLEENLDIFMKLCDAVAYAHSRGVINRDLKPENVIVGDYGEVIVLDWGLAITTDAFPRKDSVVVDFIGGAGTPVYMAPELAGEDISRIGPHSDIYLLGAILFEIVEGYPPHLLREFWGMRDPVAQLNSVIWAVVNNKIEKRVGHPGELLNIARRAMQTKPADRFHSVEELQEAIREYRITGRAEELMLAAEEDPQQTGYAEYQHAVALYDEAILKWPDNRRAQQGDLKARLAYATLAHQKGDIDLGLQIVGEDGDRHFSEIRSKLKKTRRLRTFLKTTWALLFVAAVSGVFVSTERMRAAEQATNRLTIANRELIEKDARLKDADRAVDEAVQQQEIAQQRTQEAQSRTAAAEAELIQKQALAAAAEDRAAQAEVTRDAAVDQLKSANAALQTAEADAKKARDAVVPLQEQATRLRAEIDQAQARREEAEQRAYEAGWNALNKTVTTSRDLGLFGEAIQAIDEALQSEEHGPTRRRFLQRWRQQIEADQRQTAQTTGVSQSQFSAVSDDGQVLASAERDTVTVLRPGSAAAGQPTTLQAQDQVRTVVISADGRRLAVGGRNGTQHLWDLTDSPPQQISLPETADRRLTYEHAAFSQSGSHLYFLADDADASIRILDLSQTPVQEIYAGSLAGSASGRGNFSVRSIALLPDESALLVNSRTEGVFAIPLDLQATPPVLVTARSAPGLQGLRGSESTPDHMYLSPDGSLLALALTSPNRLMILPRRDDREVSQFPFVAPHQLTDRDAAVLELGPFEVSSVAFSQDNQRLLTGFTDNYIQVWDRQDGQFVRSPAPGLWSIANRHFSLLAGHSGRVQLVAFVADSTDRVLSVGDDGRSLRFWTISAYGDYIRLFRELDGVFSTARLELLPNRSRLPEATVSTVSPPRRVKSSRRAHQPILVSTHAAVVPTTSLPTSEPTAPKAPFRIMAADGSPSFVSTYSARFSRDGQRVVVGANDRAAHVYDASDGSKTQTLSMNERRSLFFDPDRNVYLEGHIPNLQSLRVLPPDGRLLLTSDWSGSISVWDAADDEDGIGREVSRLLPRNSQSEIAVSDDGLLIFAAGLQEVTAPDTGEQQTTHVGLLWKLHTVKSSPAPDADLEFAGEHPDDEITAVAISPSGRRVVTAGRRGRIVVWDATTAEVIASADGTHNRDGVSGIAFTSDNELISGGYDGNVRRWQVEDRQLLQTPQNFQRRQIAGEPDSDDYVLSLRMAPDRRRFATTSLKQVRGPDPGSEAYLFRVTIWSVFSDLPAEELVSSSIASSDRGRAFEQGVSWSPDGSRLLYVRNQAETETTAATEIFIYDADSWKVLQRLRQAVVDPDQNLSGRERRRANAPAIQAAFMPGPEPPQQIATFDGRAAHLWNLQTGQHIAEFRAHAAVLGVSFSADRRYLATASESLRVFDAAEDSPNHSGTVFRIPGPHPGRIDDVVFSPAPDDYRIASIGATGEIKLWPWHPNSSPPAHPSAVLTPVDMPAVIDGRNRTIAGGNCVTISPDGQSLLGVQRGQLGIWDISGPQPQSLMLDLPATGQFVFNSAAFAADGQRFAAGGVRVDNNGDTDSVVLIFHRAADRIRTIAVLSGGHSGDPAAADQQAGVTALAFGVAQDTLLTGGTEGRVLEWIFADPGTDSEPFVGESFIDLRIANLPPHSRTVNSIDVSQQGAIVTSGNDGYVAIWPPQDLQ